MPWQKSYNETEVLERAMHAFWAHGYDGTSMNDLVAATGINRGSIYAAYADKHALFMAALRHYDRIYRQDFLDGIARGHAPRDAIIAAFEAAAGQCGTATATGGCLLVNTVLELSPHDDAVRDFVDASLDQVEKFFATMIKAARKDGTVPDGIDVNATAQALLGLFLGLRVLTRSKPRPAALKAITSQVAMMLR